MYPPVARAQLPLPFSNNGTEVSINGYKLNGTALNFWNYTLYTNNTISNGSDCWITVPNLQFRPTIFPNGTFINATSCYFPYWGVSERGGIGIGFGCLFGFSFMLLLTALRKHGTLFLPQEKKFRAIGRRWAYYWMCFAAACGAISSISAIDADRNYLQGSGVLIQAIFWYLMIPTLLAALWEGARHWGSWQERQLYDINPFSMHADDRRSKVEFYLPLIFYLFAWLNFFLTVPRNWTKVENQSDDWQLSTIAIPSATENRLKAAAVFGFLAWIMIPLSIWHSIKHYKSPGPLWLLRIPLRFLLTLPLCLIIIGYAAANSWIWEINISRFGANPGYIYGLGYAPAVLIVYIFTIAGLRTPNEDLELIRQRRQRGLAADLELGVRGRRKPWWWRKVGSELGMSNEDRLRALTTEGTGHARQQREVLPPQRERDNIEMEELPSYRDVERQDAVVARAAAQAVARVRERDERGRAEERSDGLLDVEVTTNEREGRSVASSRSAVSQARPQQVRSMLDV